MFKRKRDPARARLIADFERTAVHIESAHRALLAAVPTSRDAGIPLALALAGFTRALDDADATMAGWKDPSVAGIWDGCADAIGRARSEAERLRLDPVKLGFEALNARIGDVMDPLETFADAERALRGR